MAWPVLAPSHPSLGLVPPTSRLEPFLTTLLIRKTKRHTDTFWSGPPYHQHGLPLSIRTLLYSKSVFSELSHCFEKTVPCKPFGRCSLKHALSDCRVSCAFPTLTNSPPNTHRHTQSRGSVPDREARSLIVRLRTHHLQFRVSV